MIWYAPVILYSALACATVVPPPGQSVPQVQPVKSAPPPKPGTLPAPSWDFLKICTVLNEKGVQEHPSLNPPRY